MSLPGLAAAGGEVLPLAPTGNKYGARKALYGGQVYDSVGEARYAQHLDRLVAAGRLAGWRRGRVWALTERDVTGRPLPARDRIGLRVDFEAWAQEDASDLFCVDFKGVLTREFRLKAKLWRAFRPETPLYVVGKDYALRRVA